MPTRSFPIAIRSRMAGCIPVKSPGWELILTRSWRSSFRIAELICRSIASLMGQCMTGKQIATRCLLGTALCLAGPQALHAQRPKPEPQPRVFLLDAGTLIEQKHLYAADPSGA